MSWHINNKNQSLITEMINLLSDDTWLEITTFDNQYVVDKDDEIVVGSTAMFIANNEQRVLINTNYILSIEVIKVVPSG